MHNEKNMRFKRHTPEFKAKIAEKQKLIEDEYQANIQLAKECLADPKFERYQKSYEIALEGMIQLMIDIDQFYTDPVEYAFQMKEMVCKIKFLRGLVSNVQLDANRRVSDGINKKGRS